jgi:hypothetical protein
MVYLNHGLKLMDRIEARKDDIAGLVNQICEL